MTPPVIIDELVARFRANLDSYKRGAYNETQVRREFIDPFFEALGWDVSNRQGYAEAYKDVVTPAPCSSTRSRPPTGRSTRSCTSCTG